MASSFDYGQAAPGIVPRDRTPKPQVGTAGLEAMRAVFAPVDAGGGSLCSLIESEIIPRLMVASAGGSRDHAVNGDAYDGVEMITTAEVADFAPLALQVEADELLDYADRILRRGVPVTTLLVDLLAPAARLLGEYWKEDRCDFVDVTMGLWRLQEVVHEVAGRAPCERAAGARGRRALFAAMPGDQHSFGTVVIDEVFGREGWMTDRLGDAETSELLERVAGNWFDLVGLTVSCESNTGALPSVINAVRSVSRNPRVCVMVGGRVFVDEPDLARQVGADGTARDARVAVAIADRLVCAVEREVAHCD